MNQTKGQKGGPESRLRLLYSSNAPLGLNRAKSGYGVQGNSLLPRLADLPSIGGRENIAIFAWYGLQGGIHNVNDFVIYPAGMDSYGNDVIGSHARHFQADMVISLIDVWVMENTAKNIQPAVWCPWLPIDHDPVPQKVLDSLEGAYMPLTYSKWGHQMLLNAGVDNRYIPHGIEPSIYHVHEDQERVQAFRRDMPGPDCSHLTVMVAANKGFPDRKAFQVQIRAWAEFAKDVPGAILYIHTEPTPMFGGLHLPELCKSLGVDGQVRFPERYQNYLGFPGEYMSLIYNAADVYLGATMSEGFGIPIIEAQACGCPVIVTDFLAMPELVRWGVTTPPMDRFWTPMNAWQVWPSHIAIAEALRDLYDEQQGHGGQWPVSKRLKAQAAIHDEYGWDEIVRKQWAPLMLRLESTLAKKVDEPPTVPEPVANGTGQKSRKIEPAT